MKPLLHPLFQKDTTPSKDFVSYGNKAPVYLFTPKLCYHEPSFVPHTKFHLTSGDGFPFLIDRGHI